MAHHLRQASRKLSIASRVVKGGLHALTRHLALELAPHQIRVNTVARP